MTTTGRKRASIRDIREAFRRLDIIGEQMSNICWNAGQRGMTLTSDRERIIFAELANKWDVHSRALKELLHHDANS